MKVKYLICPGNVTSKNDSEVHYISARQLMELYKILPCECKIYEPKWWWSESYKEFLISVEYKNLKHLKPRYNGIYNIPEEIKCK